MQKMIIENDEDRIAAILAEYNLLALGKPDRDLDFDKPTPCQELMQKIRNRLKCELTIRVIYLRLDRDDNISRIVGYALDERRRIARKEWLAVHASPYIITDEEQHEYAEASRWLSGELKYIYQNALMYVGAASVLRMKNSVLDFGVYHEDADYDTLYNMTLDQLVSSVPEVYCKQLDTAFQIKALTKQVQDGFGETKQGQNEIKEAVEEVKANQPLTVEAARRWGAAQHQSAMAKGKAKQSAQTPPAR